MNTTTNPGDSIDYDHDVVIVGGGPAGCSAGVFTARYELDTVIFDRLEKALRHDRAHVPGGSQRFVVEGDRSSSAAIRPVATGVSSGCSSA